KAAIWIKSDAFQCAGAIAGQQREGKGKQGVDRVQRRAAGAPGKGKGWTLLQDQSIKAAEVELCRFAFDAAQFFGGHGIFNTGESCGQLARQGFQPLDGDALWMVAR